MGNPTERSKYLLSETTGYASDHPSAQSRNVRDQCIERALEHRSACGYEYILRVHVTGIHIRRLADQSSHPAIAQRSDSPAIHRPIARQSE